MKFLSFPDIEGLHNVVKSVTTYPHICPTPITYRGKIKLHGSNGAIRLSKNEVAAQSRSKIITIEDDNAGFAKWVANKSHYFASLYNANITSFCNSINEEFTFFGEWCGPGILKGTAIQKIPNKIFAIFAVMIGDDSETAKMITAPDTINDLLPYKPDDIHVLPWYGNDYLIDFTHREDLQSKVIEINEIIKQIEPEDPWVKTMFDVSGVCEGIVYVPYAGQVITRKMYSDLAFKAKGEEHKVNKTKEAVQIDPEVLASIGEFVAMFATEARFNQAIATLQIDFDTKNIGAFLKWISQDILKESGDELESSNLEWEKVQKFVQTAARNWFILKSKNI